jgi:hypothetical protein
LTIISSSSILNFSASEFSFFCKFEPNIWSLDIWYLLSHHAVTFRTDDKTTIVASYSGFIKIPLQTGIECRLVILAHKVMQCNVQVVNWKNLHFLRTKGNVQHCKNKG